MPMTPYFIAITTFSNAGNRNEALKRRKQLGQDMPGWEVLGEWTQLGGYRKFKIIKATSEECNPWKESWAYNDLATVEVIPVVETERMMERLFPEKPSDDWYPDWVTQDLRASYRSSSE